ncbi:Ldh family oxidoreductase [Streptomyces gilvus]|uniref:Ldh family oxidoreductase n=1 Tax=Streptomyces gilvus TaxID=2920937 RepID=UPI001F0D3456|nr:Ldh family oxidoreductase [Streptomyces sp. CME 23]MCH5676632.1 Ldh family oxidoreductase [Streptomyces sp. CME 23]
MSDRITVSPEWLAEAVSTVFAAAGLSPRAASVVAESLVEADLRGTPSHGVLLVPMYVERLRKGSVSTHENAEVVVDAGAIAVLDARHALGQLTGDQAMDLAIDKARTYGIGAVTVRRAFHFGGAYRYARAAAAAGCVGIAAANTRPLMPAPGGAAAVVGNNPLAFGIPTMDGEPVLLDMALSEAALGKIRLAAQEGRAIPPTWATDAAGTPTTDAEAALAGLLLPAAGHKGYGLALVVDVLTGVLSGGGFGSGVNGLYADTATPNDCAHFFLALDVSAFGDKNAFAHRVAALTDQITSSPKAPGTERLLLPGQLEAERQAAARDTGVPLDASVLEALQKTAETLGIALGVPC